MGLRRSVKVVAEPSRTQALVGSAARMSSSRMRAKRSQDGHEWQEEAWWHYDNCGELRYAASWYGQAVSRCRLVAARAGERGAEPTALSETDGGRAQQVADVVQAFAGGVAGQAQVLERLAVHLFVPGDTYLLGSDQPESEVDLLGQTVTQPEVLPGQEPAGGQQWEVLSTDEVDQSNGDIVVDDGESRRTYSDDSVLLVRVWNPHPRKHWQADSGVRAVLPTLREIKSYDAHINATIDSRLAGAGILLLPNEVSFAKDPTEGAVDGSDGDSEDPFLDELIEVMTQAIKDRDSAAALVPLLLRLPADTIDKVKHLTFSTPFDDKVLALRDQAVRRLALGLNMPPEVLLGQSDSNQWSAWQIEEASIKLHIEPMMTRICDALTVGYLHPLLRAAGVPDWADYVVWFDATDLQLRPDRGPQALDLYDRTLIGPGAALRALGFDSDDRPTTTELKAMLLLQQALKGPIDSVLVQALAGNLFSDTDGTTSLVMDPAQADPAPKPGETPRSLLDPSTPTPGATGGATGGTATRPAIGGTPTTTPGAAPASNPKAGAPAMTASAGADSAGPASAGPDSSLLDASEVLVLRALERAGSKRRSRADAELDGVPEHETHLHLLVEGEQVERLLAGAFSLVGPVAERLAVPAGPLTGSLRAFVAALLVDGQPYDRERLRAHLAGSRA